MAYRPSRIRDALSSLPAKPGVAIAIALIAVITSIYYYDNYRTCTAHRDLRERFVSAVSTAAEAAGSVVDLSDIADFDWAHVSILGEREIEGRRIDCPFGWDWSWDERTALARDGDLAVLLFSDARSAFVDFLDVRRSQVDFAELPVRYERDAARFTARQLGNNPVRYELVAAGP